MSDALYATAFERYMAGLMEGDARVLTGVIERLLEAHVPLNTIYRDFVERGLVEIGKLWERDAITVATEHLASSATELALAELQIERRAQPRANRTVVIACVPNELHEVGAIVLANVCTSAGWKTLMLGADMPAQDLLAFLARRNHAPDLLALSATLPANRVALEAELAALTSRFPDLRILIGGQAVDGPAETAQFRTELLARYPTVHFAQSLDDVERYLETIANPG